eukprot:3933282-Rhodomonas_salina.1
MASEIKDMRDPTIFAAVETVQKTDGAARWHHVSRHEGQKKGRRVRAGGRGGAGRTSGGSQGGQGGVLAKRRSARGMPGTDFIGCVSAGTNSVY